MIREVSMSDRGPRLTQPPDPMLGTNLAGKYKIIKKLGEGGMGSVYTAQQMPMDRMVAVKVLLGKLAQDEVAVRRFEQEARAVSKMQHPNTVTIYDYGKTEDDRLYIVMELLKGKTLSDALRAAGGTGLDPKRVVHIGRQVCASLADAHAAGIIHRDLKPDNIFLTEIGGSKDWVKVLDFGVAKLADNEAGATLTQTGMIFGTPKYMSPEQAEGKPIDARADIYAIGVVLFEMITGRPPFVAETPVALLLKHIAEPAPAFRKVRPDLAVAPELEGVVMKTLEKNPDKRYSRVEELANDLDACLRMLVTGPQLLAEAGTQPHAAPRALPTEVSPVAPHAGDLSPGELRPPNLVPSGISLGPPDIRRMPTEPAPPGPDQLGPRTGATRPSAPPLTAGTDFQLRHAPDPATAALGTAPGGATRPIPGTGPGIETLGGGLPGTDLSQPIRASKQPRRWPILAGVGAVAIAGVVFAVASGNQRTTVASQPLDLTQVEDPKTAAPVAAPVPVEPEPKAPVEPPVAPPVGQETGIATTRRPTRTPERVAPKAPAPAPSRKVSFRFESAPSGAIVEVDGKQIGRTPFTREFVRGDEMLSVEFRLAGYEPKRQLFTLSADRSVDVELKKLAEEPRREQPVVRPEPKRPDPATKRPETERPLDERVDDLK